MENGACAARHGRSTESRERDSTIFRSVRTLHCTLPSPAVGPLERDHYLANPGFINDPSGNPCPPVFFVPKEGTISSTQLWRSSHICEFTELPGSMSHMLGIEGPEAPQPMKCI